MNEHIKIREKAHLRFPASLQQLIYNHYVENAVHQQETSV